MKYRQTNSPPVAAAKASFSPSTAYRIENDRHVGGLRMIPSLRTNASWHFVWLAAIDLG
ncbi:hypothetical protein ABID59_004362 [Bradyrhizobium sp. S3.3.6]